VATWALPACPSLTHTGPGPGGVGVTFTAMGSPAGQAALAALDKMRVPRAQPA